MFSCEFCEISKNTFSTEHFLTTACLLSEKLLTIEMNKINVKMNKTVYLGLWIIHMSKIVTHGYWYDAKIKIWKES